MEERDEERMKPMMRKTFQSVQNGPAGSSSIACKDDQMVGLTTLTRFAKIGAIGKPLT